MKVRIDFDYKVSIKWVPQDLWLGVFIDYKKATYYNREWNADHLKVYICVLPTFPICLEFRLRFREHVPIGHNKLISKLADAATTS